MFRLIPGLQHGDFCRILPKDVCLALYQCKYSLVSNNRTYQKLWKTLFHLTCKKGQFDVVELIFYINLNAQNENGMTHFDTCTVIRYFGFWMSYIDSI